MIHPQVKDVGSLLNYLHAEELSRSFQFVWDSTTPEYVIASEHIYTNRQSNKIFRRFSNDKNWKGIIIFHGGEAVSPDFNMVDYAVGYDADLSYGDRFAQLPSPDIFPGSKFIERQDNDIKTNIQAQHELDKKTGFCNFLYSNWMAHPNRDRLFYILSSYKHVDSLGRWLNNVKEKGTGYVGHSKECVGIKSPYKFSIACENACFSGYTSEKILTSLNAHTIPVYWGDPKIIENINPAAFINCNELKNLEDVLEIVRRIDENDELWCEMVSQPWLTEEQLRKREERNRAYIGFLYHIFQQEISEAHRRPVGTHNDLYAKKFWYRNMPPSNTIFKKILGKIKKISKQIENEKTN